MPSTIIDSAIFGDIFSTAAMRRVWSDENRTAKYVAIESALAKVQGALGLIPADAAAEIVRVCHFENIDMVKLKAQTERIGYPILGVVSQINLLCRDKLGEFCHWGATTQDITDTATVLQIREALEIVDTFATMSAAEVLARLEAAQIANAQVNTMAEVWQHPQLAARGRWREVDTAAGPVPALLPPGSWDDGDGPRLDAVPALGQHTDAILRGLGLDAPAIAALRAAEAV